MARRRPRKPAAPVPAGQPRPARQLALLAADCRRGDRRLRERLVRPLPVRRSPRDPRQRVDPQAVAAGGRAASAAPDPVYGPAARQPVVRAEFRCRRLSRRRLSCPQHRHPRAGGPGAVRRRPPDVRADIDVRTRPAGRSPRVDLCPRLGGAPAELGSGELPDAAHRAADGVFLPRDGVRGDPGARGFVAALGVARRPIGVLRGGLEGDRADASAGDPALGSNLLVREPG